MNLDMTNETALKMNLEFTPGGLIQRQAPSLSCEESLEDTLDLRLQTAQWVEGGALQGAVSWDREKVFYWEMEQDGAEPCLRGTWLTTQPNTLVVDFSFYTKVDICIAFFFYYFIYSIW